MILRTIQRRRWTARDVAAFVAALLVGATVTAQMRDAGETAPDVSKFVYPEQADTIRFDHAKHRETSCTSCHAAARTSQRSDDDLLPAMEACAGCHQTTEPKLGDCASCHVGYSRAADGIEEAADWKAVRPAPMKIPRAASEIRFDHAAHVGTMGSDASCSTCHGDGDDMPTMESCTTCHNGTDTAPPSDCATCHRADPSTGKLRTERGTTTLRPDNHSVAFLKRHATVAKSGAEECMACHVEQDCASCHNATVAKPFAVHPPNFLTIHASDARANPGNCTDCHTTQTFCTSCHVRSDVVTSGDHRPPPRRRFHPPGWLDATTTANHGVMARRDITDCASCHTENDCVSCHAGINPHPTDFRMDCGRMLAANPAPCARCHSDPAALRALCL